MKGTQDARGKTQAQDDDELGMADAERDACPYQRIISDVQQKFQEEEPQDAEAFDQTNQKQKS